MQYFNIININNILSKAFPISHPILNTLGRYVGPRDQQKLSQFIMGKRVKHNVPPPVPVLGLTVRVEVGE